MKLSDTSKQPADFPYISESIIYELSCLFDAVSPGQLRKSLHQILFRYLIQSYDIQRNDFQKIMQDIYVLTEFLEKAEEMQRK